MAKKKTTPTTKTNAAEKPAGRSTRTAKPKRPPKPAPSPAAETVDPVPEPETETTAKPGRPSGSKNLDRVTVQRHPATCPQCGSTDRKVQRIAKEQARGGVLAQGPNAGATYTHTVWRDTVCVCGQALREVSHENRGE